MTARSLELIARADLVLYDRLVPATALDGARPEAELVYVGKRPGAPGMGQEEINRRLVDAGREGLRVVRLKGGDPFVFGRGSEEAAALAEAGFGYEVVPGVTAGVAAPAYAGIPATHRGTASAVAFVAGHEDPAKPDTAIDWGALARFPGTLVFYMGVARLASNAAALIEAGRPAEEPAAVIERGSTPGQRVVTGTLGTIAAEAERAGIEAPAVAVVGEVAGLREGLAWFEKGPLFGLEVVVTRARPGAGALAGRLRALGAEPVELPLIRIEPRLDTPEVSRAIAGLGRYDLVCLTSPNGVGMLFEALGERGLDGRALAGARLAAIGPGTAAALARNGLTADLVPESFVAEGLAESFASLDPPPGRALMARASGARQVIPEALHSAGCSVDDVGFYDAVAQRPGPDGLDRLRGSDWITFTSASAVRSLAEALDGKLPEGPRVVSIGPVTSEAIRKLGWSVDAEAESHDVDGLISVLLDATASR